MDNSFICHADGPGSFPGAFLQQRFVTFCSCYISSYLSNLIPKSVNFFLFPTIIWVLDSVARHQTCLSKVPGLTLLNLPQWAKAITSTQINSNHHKFIIMPCIVVRLNIRECCSTIKMYQSLLKLIKMNQKLLEPVKWNRCHLELI